MYINKAKKIVIKLGSSTIVDSKGLFKKKWVKSLIADIKKGSTIFDFTDILKTMLELKTPLVCTNPDFQVDSKGIMEMCGGTVAQLYQDMGGFVLRYGKPYNPIYSNIVKKFKITLPENVLVIGDSFNHDILGATKQGFDSLWIENGIHREDAKQSDRLKWYLREFKPKFSQFMLKF